MAAARVARADGRSVLAGRAIVVAAVGCALVGGAVALVVLQEGVASGRGNAEEPRLAFVAQKDIADAATTLTAAVAGPLVEDAKRCRVPLAEVVVSRGTAATDNVFRIRSGSYVSPLFAVTDTPQRIALPYPSSYGSGSGTLAVEGTANGLLISLSPAKVVTGLPGELRLPVVWRPTTPC